MTEEKPELILHDRSDNVAPCLPLRDELVAPGRQSTIEKILIDIRTLAKRMPRASFIRLGKVAVELISSGFDDHFHRHPGVPLVRPFRSRAKVNLFKRAIIRIALAPDQTVDGHDIVAVIIR